ncbi:MAG TPA: hypothetical protein PKN99_04895 [Cyclobacteriaceae bacterium]|nr:hypothetical protein [Cyclobacteriaceae bacterium]
MKSIITAVIMLSVLTQVNAQQMKVVTVVESIVPMGIGRSRIIEHQQNVNTSDFTTARTDGRKSVQKEIKRSDVKIEKLTETKLLNFYSGVGINFQNIASNDALITAKVNEMLSEGWQLTFVTSGVESVGSASDNHGIYITRLFFTKP